MLKIFKNSLNRKYIETWSRKRFFEIIILMFFVFSLFLLRSAGYFHPYFEISINFILFTSLILCIVIFKANSRFFFVVSILFWTFAGTLKLLKVDVWAERTMIYCFQSLLIGVFLMIMELLKDKKRL